MTKIADAPYHHGALRSALLAAGEKLLREGGVGALTLRAVGREAGVSHGAPAHHFKDLSALVSELAAVGFHRLADQLRAAFETRGSSRFPLPKAYLTFALENRALFALMFRDERLDSQNPALREARKAALDMLSESTQARLDHPDIERLGALTASWAMTHGFAVLATEGRLTPVLRAMPEGGDMYMLLEATFAAADLKVVKPDA